MEEALQEISYHSLYLGYIPSFTRIDLVLSVFYNMTGSCLSCKHNRKLSFLQTEPEGVFLANRTGRCLSCKQNRKLSFLHCPKSTALSAVA